MGKYLVQTMWRHALMASLSDLLVTDVLLAFSMGLAVHLTVGPFSDSHLHHVANDI